MNPTKNHAKYSAPELTKIGAANHAGSHPALLADIKQRIRTAQVRTAMAGNASLLMLYWKIGSELVKRQKREGWGTKVLPRLAADVKNELPEEKGFSERNLKRMQRFAREYPDLFSKVPPPVAQLDRASPIRPRAAAKTVDTSDPGIGQPAVAQTVPQAVALLPRELATAGIWPPAIAKLPWAHKNILFEKVKDLPSFSAGVNREAIARERSPGVTKSKSFSSPDSNTTASSKATGSGV